MKPDTGAFITIVRARSLVHEAGQTLVEYSLILALLAMAIVATLSVVGGDVGSLYTSIEDHVQNATTP